MRARQKWVLGKFKDTEDALRTYRTLERALTAYKAQIMSKAELIAEAIAQVRMAKEREVFQWTGG